jgi:phosphoglycolate phosphatase-like HAD superfamily hydrolase
VTPALLRELSVHFQVRACTGRSRWELKLAEELLEFTFPLSTTSEDVKKPDPRALLRLVPDGTLLTVMLGDSEDDRRTVERARPLTRAPIRYHHVVETPLPFLNTLLEAG